MLYNKKVVSPIEYDLKKIDNLFSNSTVFAESEASSIIKISSSDEITVNFDENFDEDFDEDLQILYYNDKNVKLKFKDVDNN